MSNKKFSFLIFDLDGVIFDTKKNMQLAWFETCRYFGFKKSFNEYFKYIGLPFEEILENLSIKPNKKIYEKFKKNSFKNIKFVKPFTGVKIFLKNLETHGIKYSIVTSKDYKRSKYLLKKFKIYPVSIHCPNNKLRGKPHPDHIIKSLKKNKIHRDKACYIGDTSFDYITAKRSKIDFIFAKYGYGKDKKYYKNKILKFSDLKKFV